MNISCPCCKSNQIRYIRKHSITSANISSTLYLCDYCDLLFLGDPNQWLDVAYQVPFRNDGFYGMRNIRMAIFLQAFLYISTLFKRLTPYSQPKDVHVTDFGCGIGLMSHLLGSISISSSGMDKFSTPILLQKSHIDVDFGKASLVTAFEVLEHIPNTSEFLSLLSPDKHDFIFSTTLRPDNIVPSPSWSYYDFDVGQHITFHSKRSLSAAFKNSGLNPKFLLSTSLGIHIYSPSATTRLSFLISLVPLLIVIAITKCLKSFNNSFFKSHRHRN